MKLNKSGLTKTDIKKISKSDKEPLKGVDLSKINVSKLLEEETQAESLARKEKYYETHRKPYETHEQWKERMSGAERRGNYLKENGLNAPILMKQFPEDPLTLATIQEGLLSISGTDILSLSIRLGAKTDIRRTIVMIQEMYSRGTTLLKDIPNIELILAYESKA